MGVSRVSQGCLKSLSRVFKGFTRGFKCFEGVSQMLQYDDRKFKHASMQFKGCFKNIIRVI